VAFGGLTRELRKEWGLARGTLLSWTKEVEARRTCYYLENPETRESADELLSGLSRPYVYFRARVFGTQGGGARRAVATSAVPTKLLIRVLGWSVTDEVCVRKVHLEDGKEGKAGSDRVGHD